MVEIVNTKGDSLDAVVVENTREGKKIRQRVICHLGVVHEKTAKEIRDRVLFWKYTVGPKLDQLNLAPDTRSRIEAQLSVVIPIVSKEEQDQYQAVMDTKSRKARIKAAQRFKGAALFGTVAAAYRAPGRVKVGNTFPCKRRESEINRGKSFEPNDQTN